MSGRIVYGWVAGCSRPPLDPQVLGEELERIRAKAGDLTPAAVLDAASRKRSVLHGAFEWDDVEAGKKYRVWQARQLIGSVMIKSIDDEPSPPVRAFVSVTKDSQRAYVPTADARDDLFLRKQMLDRACAEALAWRQRYCDLAEFSGVVAEIDKTAKRLRRTG